MNTRVLMLVVIFAATLIAGGCAMEKSRLERDYGTSHELQKYNQTANPEAEKNQAPVTGMNGQAAQNAVEKYQKEFEKPSQASTSYQINIGSMGK